MILFLTGRRCSCRSIPRGQPGGMRYAHAAQRGEAQECVHDGGFMYASAFWRNAA
jgi:hypothetical protein